MGDYRMEQVVDPSGATAARYVTPQNGRLLAFDTNGLPVLNSTRQPNMVTRPIGASPTSFQPSATLDSVVTYTVQIASNISLSGSSLGSVFLEVSQNNSTWTEIARAVNNQSGTLVVGLALNQTLAIPLFGYIPPGYYVRIRTVTTNSGTPGSQAAFTYLAGQETIL